MHFDGGCGVFGDGGGCQAVDGLKGCAADECGGSAEEGGVPEVEAFLSDLVEHVVFGGDGVVDVEVAFDGVWVEEEVRGLDEGDFGVGE